MGNAGVDCRDPGTLDLLIYELARAAGRNGNSVKLGFAHIHLGPKAALHLSNLDGNNARQRLHIEGLANIACLPCILGQTADAIAAHLCL